MHRIERAVLQRKTLVAVCLALACVPIHIQAAALDASLVVSPFLSIHAFPESHAWWVPDNTKPDEPPVYSVSWWEYPSDVLMRYYRKKSPLQAGFQYADEHVRIAMIIDTYENPYGMYRNPDAWSNLPFLGNSLDAITDVNFPRVGYADLSFGAFHASIGRRQVKWGAMEYGLAINDNAPYQNHIEIEYLMRGKRFPSLRYTFLLLSFNAVGLRGWERPGQTPEDIDTIDKSLFAHKLSLEGISYRFSLSELLLVYDRNFNATDFLPFNIWHNLYYDQTTNVLLSLDGEGTVGDMRLYGSFVMDDFDLSHETPGLKPTAMGFAAGMEWHALEGRELQYADMFERSDHRLQERTLRARGGLLVGGEFYYLSNFLYNRNIDAGKFTVPWNVFASGAGYLLNPNAFMIGFPYGPGSMLARFVVSYETRATQAEVSFEWLRRGSRTIDSPYDTETNRQVPWIGMVSPVTDVLICNISGQWYPRGNLKVASGIRISWDLTHLIAGYEFQAGCSIAI